MQLISQFQPRFLFFQINGVNTQGENIADNGGLHEAFRAYVRSVESEGEDPQLPGLEQYTNEQLFFISYSQVYIFFVSKMMRMHFCTLIFFFSADTIIMKSSFIYEQLTPFKKKKS